MKRLSVDLTEKVLYEHLVNEIGFAFKCLECGSLDTRLDNNVLAEGNRFIVEFYIHCNNCGNQSTLSRAIVGLDEQ